MWPDPSADLDERQRRAYIWLRTCSQIMGCRYPDRIISDMSERPGILIEWQVAGHYFEAEITETGQIEWMHRSPDGVYTHSIEVFTKAAE